MASALEWLLAPVLVDTFIETYWGKQYLHLGDRPPASYDDLLSSDLVLKKSFSGQLHYPHLRVKRDGVLVLNENLLRGSNYNLEELDKELQRGSTFNLTNIHLWNKPVLSLVKALRPLLNCHVFASAFFTPVKTVGHNHSVHFDPVDTFILQVEGQKLWRFYESPRLGTIHVSYREKPTPVLSELLLQPGDLLYVPRGMVHSVDTDDFSLHINIAIEPLRAADILIATIEKLAEEKIEFRQHLKPDYKECPEVWKEQARTILQQTADVWEAYLPNLEFDWRYGKVEE